MKPTAALLLSIFLILSACQGESTPQLEEPTENTSELTTLTQQQQELTQRLSSLEQRIQLYDSRLERMQTRLDALAEQPSTGPDADAMNTLGEELALLRRDLDALRSGRVAPPTSAPTPPVVAARPAAGVGTLTINAVPSAAVFIDGVMVSEMTPLVDYEVAAGDHTVQVQYQESQAFSAERRVLVERGRSGNLFFSQ